MTSENLLDTSNRHCHVYSLEGLQVEILRGIRVDIRGRLWITIKIAKGE